MKAKSGLCARCGTYRWKLDKDHIIPKSRGGTDTPSNRQYLCQNCHCDKTFSEDKVHSTVEARERQSKLQKGKKLSPETREKIRQARIGQRHSEETKTKIREINGEHLARLSASHKGIKRADWGSL